MAIPVSLRLAATLAAAVWMQAALAAPPASPPVAPVRDVVETYHGTAVHDPYRYMENLRDPEVQAWMKAQGDYARDTLDRIAGRAELEKRIAELSTATGDAVGSVVRMPGERIYYLKRPRGERQFKLMMRQGLDGAERVLVDPEGESRRTGVPHALDYYAPSWDGKYLAYGMSAGGSEDASLHVIETATGKLVAGPIPRAVEHNLSWHPDSRTVVFNQFRMLKPGEPDTETFKDSRVMALRVGAGKPRLEPVLSRQGNPGLGLSPLDVGFVQFAPDSPWVIGRTNDTTQHEGLLLVAPAADIGRAKVRWKVVAKFEDGIVETELRGHELFFRTRSNAPRFKVMKLDLRKPRLALATQAALPPEDGVIENIVLDRTGLYAAVRQGASIGVRRYEAGDAVGKPVPLPFAGAARLHDDPAHAYDNLLYTLSGWRDQPREFLWAGQDSRPLALRSAPAPSSLPEIEVLDVKVPSHDGVLVPMTIVHRRGLVRDGSNPTLLNGYGSYGMSETAGFRPAMMAWIERGGVYAIANVRGSGVYGQPWRLAGFKQTKPNTWKDGIACAQYLIDQGFASPRTMAISGGSAGGIFAGRAVTAAPQLFAAGLFYVGALDAVRAEESANGVTNISEFGSVKNPAEFPALLEMSTYHQIRDGVAYPAVMLLHGLNDPRVDPWNSSKTAARLQAATSSGKPVLLRLDAQAGHGMGSTVNQAWSMSADAYSFLLWQMGKTRLND